MDAFNVFIAFEIIEKSDPRFLYKEMDLLIIAGKRIHLWSKTKTPSQMEAFCSALEIIPEDYNKDLHIKIRDLRFKGKKTYQEIAETLKVDIKIVGFYVKNDPNKSWKLSDWIIGYHIKDSSIYEKVDYLVDCDKTLVDRFKRAGRNAIYIEKV